MNDMRSLLWASALILGGAPVAPAMASDAEPLAVQLKRCASMSAAETRLACYDALAESAGSKPVVAPPTAAGSAAAPGAAPASTEMQFGVHNGVLEKQLIAPQREKRLLAVVSGISSRPRGELVVTLDNGQVWVQIQPATYPLKAGDHVEIDVGALGSYVLWCPSSRRATKVTRIS